MSVAMPVQLAVVTDSNVTDSQVTDSQVTDSQVTDSQVTSELTGRGPAGSDPAGGEVTGTVFASAEVVAAVVDPIEAELSWQERALCAQTDPESFFPEKGGSTREAKKVCTGCEVRAECLEYALAHDERFGIWGGLSERERRRLKKAAV